MQVIKVGEQPVVEAKTYPNPIHEAMKLQFELDSGTVKSRAELSRKAGISRAKVTQMLNLLKLDREIIDFVRKLEETDPLLLHITER